MRYPTPTGRTRWHRLLVAAAATLLVLAAVATYSLVANRHQTPRKEDKPGEVPAHAVHSPEASSGVGTLPPTPTATDPERFARAVAVTLFTWDTATMTTPAELTKRLVAAADPTGESSAGLVADIANYLPTPNAWVDLREYETRQWIEITSAKVPSLWSAALEQAGPDGLLPGTTAYTVRGVRHRAGVWEGDPVASEHDVAFTVFMVCKPSYPECHLLRLSILNKPLE